MLGILCAFVFFLLVVFHFISVISSLFNTVYEVTFYIITCNTFSRMWKNVSKLLIILADCSSPGKL